MLSFKTFSRNISMSIILNFGKRKKPFDPRFPIPTKYANRYKPGGSEFAEKMLGNTENSPQLPGYYDEKENFHFVPEMVPEFVVPDLSNFKLKPYVSYQIEDLHQSELTTAKLFAATIGKEVIENIRSRKINIEDIEKKLLKNL